MCSLSLAESISTARLIGRFGYCLDFASARRRRGIGLKVAVLLAEPVFTLRGATVVPILGVSVELGYIKSGAAYLGKTASSADNPNCSVGSSSKVRGQELAPEGSRSASCQARFSRIKSPRPAGRGWGSLTRPQVGEFEVATGVPRLDGARLRVFTHQLSPKVRGEL